MSVIDLGKLSASRQRAAGTPDPSRALLAQLLIESLEDLPPLNPADSPCVIDGLPEQTPPPDLSWQRIDAHDETVALPYPDQSLERLVRIGRLRTVNDVPAWLSECRRVLRPGGILLTDAPGGETLCELKHVLRQAEAELTGGLAPRFLPVFNSRDAGSLLQRCGFNNPVVSVERRTVRYRRLQTLFADLRAAVSDNVGAAGVHPLPRAVVRRAFDYYEQFYYDGTGYAATFEILLLSGCR